MSEEEKAIKRLEEMTKNYSLNSEDLHYAIILYYLIINLQKENKILRENAENNDKVVDKANWENLKLKEHIEKYEHYCKTTGIEELMQQNKKYKEVIEKALDFIDCHFKEMVADEEAQELKSILKEVE